MQIAFTTDQKLLFDTVLSQTGEDMDGAKACLRDYNNISVLGNRYEFLEDTARDLLFILEEMDADTFHRYYLSVTDKK